MCTCRDVPGSGKAFHLIFMKGNTKAKRFDIVPDVPASGLIFLIIDAASSPRPFVVDEKMAFGDSTNGPFKSCS